MIKIGVFVDSEYYSSISSSFLKGVRGWIDENKIESNKYEFLVKNIIEGEIELPIRYILDELYYTNKCKVFIGMFETYYFGEVIPWLREHPDSFWIAPITRNEGTSAENVCFINFSGYAYSNAVYWFWKILQKWKDCIDIYHDGEGGYVEDGDKKGKEERGKELIKSSDWIQGVIDYISEYLVSTYGNCDKTTMFSTDYFEDSELYMFWEGIKKSLGGSNLKNFIWVFEMNNPILSTFEQDVFDVFTTSLSYGNKEHWEILGHDSVVAAISYMNGDKFLKNSYGMSGCLEVNTRRVRQNGEIFIMKRNPVSLQNEKVFSVIIKNGSEMFSSDGTPYCDLDISSRLNIVESKLQQVKNSYETLDKEFNIFKRTETS